MKFTLNEDNHTLSIEKYPGIKNQDIYAMELKDSKKDLTHKVILNKVQLAKMNGAIEMLLKMGKE